MADPGSTVYDMARHPSKPSQSTPCCEDPPERLSVTGMGTCGFFFFPNEKGQLQNPSRNLSNIENSHNCHSTYFWKCKNKRKGFVILVYLLSKYTVIRVSYVIWQNARPPFGFVCSFLEGHGNSWSSAFCFHSFAPAPVPKAIGRAWLDPDS